MLHWHLSDEFCHTAAPTDDKDSSKKSFSVHNWTLLTQKRSEICCRTLFNPKVTQNIFFTLFHFNCECRLTPTHKQKQTKTFSLTKTLRNVAYSSSFQLSSQFLSSCNVGMPHTARNSTWNSLQISKALEKAAHPVCTWGGYIRLCIELPERLSFSNLLTHFQVKSYQSVPDLKEEIYLGSTKVLVRMTGKPQRYCCSIWSSNQIHLLGCRNAV